MHESLKGFIESPIISEYIQREKIYNLLSEALKHKMYQKKKLSKSMKPKLRSGLNQGSMLQRNGSFNRGNDFGTEQSNRNHHMLDSSLNSTSKLNFQK